mgnify:CR=1 FL=1
MAVDNSVEFIGSYIGIDGTKLQNSAHVYSGSMTELIISSCETPLRPPYK